MDTLQQKTHVLSLFAVTLIIVVDLINCNNDWCNEAISGSMFRISLESGGDKCIKDCAITWPRLSVKRKSVAIDAEIKGKFTTLSLEALGQRIQLALSPSHSLLSNDFIFLSRGSLYNEVVLQKPNNGNQCSYKILQEAGKLDMVIGTLNVCHGIEGYWRSDDASSFALIPLPSNASASIESPHVLIIYKDKETKSGFKKRIFEAAESSKLIETMRVEQGKKFRFFPDSKVSHFNAMKNFLSSLFLPANPATTKSSLDEKLRRNGHEVDDEARLNATIELAIFVDRDLFLGLQETFPQDTDNHVIEVITAMMSAVQILFDDDSLGHNVTLVIKRLEVLKEEPPELKKSVDIQDLLKNFCQWQATLNSPGLEDKLHWDHALFLTGLDLKSLTKDGIYSNKIVGLAPVSGMCETQSSCTVSEGSHFESIFVIAHELGHSLGMKHDGRNDLNECDPGGYLMSPTLGNGKNSWSACSRKYLSEFLKSSQSDCLSSSSSSMSGIGTSGYKTGLPGEVFDADTQCKLQFGPNSRHSKFQSGQHICTDLHCIKDHYTWASHSALEGTDCGLGKWCRRGVCARKDKVSHDHLEDLLASVGPATLIVPKKIDGQWSSWSDYSNCSCQSWPGIVGLKKAIRKCDNPPPQNGGHSCTGHAEKFILCTDSSDCSNDASANDNVEKTCHQASLIDPDILPFGDAQNTSSCQIHCFKAGPDGGSVSNPQWLFPDGTKCKDDGQHFCVRGQCQRFTCDSRSEFRVASAKCQERTQRHAVWTHWKILTGCTNPCLSPGAGLRLVTRECLTSKCQGLQHSVQLCTERTAASSFHCQNVKTPQQYASDVCSKYAGDRLSGKGIQLNAISEDPDRACKVSCQDANIDYRFYVVSSKDGWFPSGTTCSSNAFCVMGKCLVFGEDLTPKYDLTGEEMMGLKNLMVRPRSLRFKRELWVEPPQRVAIGERHLQDLVSQINATHFANLRSISKDVASVSEIAFHEPIDVHDTIPTADFEISSSITVNVDAYFIQLLLPPLLLLQCA